MQNLNSYQLPLTGMSLIEASAGTGKTYTIANLYLRLLLGRGCDPLTTEQILLVTFTNAATAELRQRIRSRIYSAHQAFLLGESDDNFIQALIRASEDIETDIRRLYLALRSMDDAAIFTIHGLCQRVLSEYAFDSNSGFGLSLILDETPLLQRAIEDFWRCHIVTLPPEQFEQVSKVWGSLDKLMREVRLILSRAALIDYPAMPGGLSEAEQDYTDAMLQAAMRWQNMDMAGTLLKAGLHKGRWLGKAENIATLSSLLEARRWQDPWLINAFENLNDDKLAGATTKCSTLPEDFSLGCFEAANRTLQRYQQEAYYGILQQAVAVIKQRLATEKEVRQVQSSDDLLAKVYAAVQANPALCAALLQQYPVALIDEFQDTDPQQFGIFNQIYRDAGGLIMIGDPKQAIYAFRGADIFTYLHAKQLVPVERQFTLGTNYRSRRQVVEVVNGLFALRHNSFMQQQIPFQPAEASKTPRWQVPINADTALEVLLADEAETLPEGTARELMARECALRIARWLNWGQQGEALIDGRALQAGDCCVLVRDRTEAASIRKALTDVNISSVFMGRNSVFASASAEQMLLLIQALLEPGNDYFLRSAVASPWLGYSAEELDGLLLNDLAWQRMADTFWHANHLWASHGIMHALMHIEQALGLYSRIIRFDPQPERVITDFRHLAELLQEKSQQLHGMHQLVKYLQDAIHHPEPDNEIQQLRLESDANLVQIVTIHRSKGLQYPLVFMPFVTRVKKARDGLHHQDTQLVYKDASDEKAKAQADQERLAEDIRLLYVGLTRAEHLLCIGLVDMAISGKQSGLQDTAIGYLLQMEQLDGDTTQASRLSRALAAWQQQCPAQIDVITTPQSPDVFVPPQAQQQTYRCATLSAPIKRRWMLTSYSALARQTSHADLHGDQPGWDEGQTQSHLPAAIAQSDLTRFRFVKGAQAGSFLHAVFEHCPFDQPQQLDSVVAEQATFFGITEQTGVAEWLAEVLATPLGVGCALQHLSAADYLAEMEFHIPLNGVSARQFNQCLRDNTELTFPQYQFEQLQGMLKGFIDLTFCYQGRYYVADYKSNHLGERFEDYDAGHCHQAMQSHDYYLQAVLYCVALHRHLRLHLADYDYQTHHGGALYLFIRGMHPAQKGQGIVHFKPPYALIESLDHLFSGKAVTC